MDNKVNLKTIDTVDTSPFKKLVMTIGELPTSFIESMTYYEALAWFVKYLQDTIIPTVNNNGEAVAELQNEFINLDKSVDDRFENLTNLFIQLKDYVDNYFDELDVQEEINNKLDEMTENGTLQNIIYEYINAKALFGFDNVESMKSSVNLVDGSYAQTLGFYSMNDGGGATYKIREITNSDVVDEKFIIAIGSGTLIAELVTENTVNICQVGGQQNLGATCNYVIGLGKSVYIPKMQLNCETTILLDQGNTNFICDGQITFTADNSTFMRVKSSRNIIKFNGSVFAGSTNIFMEMGADGYNTNNTVFVEAVRSSKIGLLLNPNGNSKCVQFLQFTFNQINASEKGIFLNCGNTGEPWINANTFRGGVIQSPYGIVSRKGTNQTDPYNDNNFERIAFESVDRESKIICALDLQFMENSWFNKVRIVEDLLTDSIEYSLDNCKNIYIENCGRIYTDRISITNATNDYVNTFKGSIILNHYGVWISNTIIYYNNIPYIPKESEWIEGGNLLSVSSTSTEWSGVPNHYSNDLTVIIGDNNTSNSSLTYTLPDIFDKYINSFYLWIQTKRSTSELTLNTHGGETIMAFPTGNEIQYKLYHIERGTARGTHLPKWKVIEANYIDPTE